MTRTAAYIVDMFLNLCRQRWLDRARLTDRVWLHTYSGWGSGAALACCPPEHALQLPDSIVQIAVRQQQDPLVREFYCISGSPGRFVRTKQSDPAMGPSAQFDIVESAVHMWAGGI